MTSTRVVLRRWLVSSGVLAVLLAITLPGRVMARLPQRALIAGAALTLLATLVLGRRPARWTRDRPLVWILVVAAVVRVGMATTQKYIDDEENNAIPLARSISFTPGYVNLPLRGENHPALPGYLVKASGGFFGRDRTGYRMLSVLLGLLTVLVVYELAIDSVGPLAARWAAALLAFNDYYLGVSTRATAHVPHLLLVAVALLAYGRFIRSQRPGYIYAAAASTGLAFYAKEHSALLLPVFFLGLLATSQRRWLRTPHPYLACLVFAACIAPDLYWNMKTPDDTATTTYGLRTRRQATYTDHFRRLGGVALSPYPTMFYAKTLVQAIAQRVNGAPLKDETPEYRSINSLLGLLLIGAVLFTAVARRARDDLQRLLVIQFAVVFLFFSLIRPGNTPGRLDPVSWIWIETTIFPAVVLTGARLADATGLLRRVSWSTVGVALGWAIVTALRGR